MSDFTGCPGDPRPRSPSPGRGGRFDDGGRRSPPVSDRWPAGVDRGVGGPLGAGYRARSPDFARKRRRDDSPPSRDRYIPNYEREPYRERERRDHPHSLHDHDRSIHNNRHGPSPEMFDDPYRRSGSAYRDEPFGYSPERGMPGRGGLNHSRSHLTPPSELPHLVSFRYFADFMRSTSPHIAEDKNKLAEQWKHYRQDYTRKQLVTFFEENKSKPWFREKYQPGPEFEELRERLKRKGREGKVEAFTQRLEKGELDIISYDYLPLSKKLATPKPPAETSDGQTPNGVKSENAACLPSTTASGEGCEAKPFPSVAKDEEAEVALPGSEVKVTLTQPDGGVKIERPSIATDPEAEDFEDPDDELSASMAEAMTGSNSGLAPSSMLGSLIGESIRGKTGADDVVILLPSERQLFIKSISPDISRVELENHCKQAEGFDYLALSDPHTGKKLHRVGWVSFLPETDMKTAENTLSESKINNFTLHMMKTERPAFQKLRMCPGVMNSPDRISKDLVQIRRLATQFENEYFGVGASEDKRGTTAIEAKIKRIKEEMNEAEDQTVVPKAEVSEAHTPELGAVETEAETKPVVRENKNPQTEKKALDLYLYYLRTAFNCCYYCVCVCDFQEELLRRCAKHVRRPAPAIVDDGTNASTPQSHRRNGHGAGPKANEASWARTLDERLALLLARTDVDPREFGGERIDDEIHRLCQPQITDEGAGKFRCKNCSKLFKAMNFIEKHIMTKHGEVINQDSIERIKYLNNYVLDPSHTPPQPPPVPDYSHLRSNNGASGGMAPPHGMMPNMGPIGNSEFHNGGYPPMMNNPMAGPGGMMIGGPYGGYPPPMYAAYPNHAYPPMAGPPPMFANGPMMDGPPGSGGPPGGYGPYYMNAMGPGPGYPPPFQPPHHQVYSSLPAIPPMPQGRMGNGSSRRLGDRISRNFADDSFLPVPAHEAKRTRREEQQHMGGRANGGRGGAGGSGAEVVASDPRSKTVLAYNDLDTPAGDEVVLNY